MVDKQTKVVVSGETSKYERSMKRLAASDKKITRDMQYRWAKVKSVMTGMVGKVAALAGIGGMILLGKRALETGDIIHKLNLRLGISTEALSELQHVSNLSGVSFQTTAKSYQKMSENISDATMGIGTAKDSIADLNMDLATLHAMSPEKQFEAIADAMTGITNQSDKIRIAADIFGGRGVEMLQIMDKGAAGIREMRDQADRLGMTLSQDAANNIAAFNDAMERLSGAVMGAARSIMAKLGPELTIMVDFFGNKIPKAIEIAIKPLKVWAEIWQTLGWIASGQKGMMPELPAPMVAPEAQKKSPLGISGDVMNNELALLVEKEEQKFQIAMESQTRMEEMLGSSYMVMNEMDNTRAQQEIALATNLEAEIVSLKQRSAQSQMSIARGLFTTALNLAGVQGKKMFIVQKVADVGIALMSAFKGSAIARANPPGPPWTEPVAQMALKAGLMNAAAIAAVSLGQITAPSGATGGGTYVSPTVTTPAEIIPPIEEKRGTLTINIQGDILGDEGTIDMLIERINEAEDRDVFINQTNYATELV